jgi:von Hippel-Lindau disease tumor supressor
MMRLTLRILVLALVAICSQKVGAQPSDCSLERSLRSTEGKRATSINFKNSSGRTINVYWLDYSGKRKLYQQLPPGKSFTQQTFATHPWVVTGPDDRCISIFFSQTGSVTADVNSPERPLDAESCKSICDLGQIRELSELEKALFGECNKQNLCVQRIIHNPEGL